MNGLALCAGIGGLELGLTAAIPSYHCVCYVEREAYPASILVSRMEEGWLDKAPIWDDLQTFDGRPWRGVVDIVSAGFPCQPWSWAGQRAGADDERWLWPEIQRTIRQVGPSIVFLENVPGLLSGGVHTILGDLADHGFDAEWGVFSARGSGAPHIRRRLFILAYSSWGGFPWSRIQHERKSYSGGGCSRKELANTDRKDGNEESRITSETSSQIQNRTEISSSPDMAYPSGSGLLWKGANRGRSSYSGTKPCSWWNTEPRLGRVAYGIANRVDRLYALGNAVVPTVASRAFLTLSQRAIRGEG